MFPFDGKVNLVSKVVKIQVYFPSKIILVLFSLTVLDKFDMIKIKLLYKDQKYRVDWMAFYYWCSK